MSNNRGYSFAQLFVAAMAVIGAARLILTPALGAFTEEEMKRFEAFARDNAMLTAQVSPHGKHLLTIIREGVDTDPILLVFETADLSKRPVGIDASKMEIRGAFWANNERIIVRFGQDIDTLERVGIETRQAGRFASIDIKGEKFVGLPRRNVDRRREASEFLANLSRGEILSLMPWDPEHILMSVDTDQDLVSNVYRVNVETGAQTLVANNSEDQTVRGFDRDGDVRISSRFSAEELALVYYARLKGETDWFPIYRFSAKGPRNAVSITFDPLGFYNLEDPNELWVLSNHEHDTAGIYAFDLNTRQFGDLLFHHPEFDARDVITKLDASEKPVPIGFYFNEKVSFQPYLTDASEVALQKGIDARLPNAINYIVSRSRDESLMIISSEGPQRPPTWFLLKDKKEIISLGTERPELDSDDLSPSEWTHYNARDGRKIWTIVTTPKGDGPFPAIVMPHGGPIQRDSWGFDRWAQMLASFGYVVIQPQFRISLGFGIDHLEAGYAQWGLTMQDDLDDAAGYLVERGLAERDNIGIFGWSYGGYAAFIGSARDPNPYRCAIAGAGVADIPKFRAWAGENRFRRESFRKTLVGTDPLSITDSVDIPILVIHGDKDERVSIAESNKIVAGLRRHNKQHEYLILKDANHFFGTIYYRHYMEMYPKMIDWLDNTCGMKRN